MDRVIQMDEIIPDVSIAMVTYNHENYIEQAVRSVMNQKCDLSIQLIVGEDCSTDGTKKILLELKKVYGNKLKLILNKFNLGPQKNFWQTISECNGKYVMILDGDDYWISEDKIQKQYEFMTENPNCSVSWHQAYVFHENKTKKSFITHSTDKYKKTLDINTLIFIDFMPTSSLMFKNNLFNNIPQWFYNLPMADYPLNLLNAQFGDLGYVEGILSARRIHDGGIWGPHKEAKRIFHLESFIEFLWKFNKYTSEIYHETIIASILKKVIILNTYYEKDTSVTSEKRIKLNCLMDKLKQCSSLNIPKRNYTYMWGTGEMAEKVSPYFTFFEIKIKEYIDNDPTKDGMKFQGVLISSPKIKHFDSKSNIFISSTFYDEIASQLKNEGLEDGTDFYNSFYIEELILINLSSELREEVDALMENIITCWRDGLKNESII